MSKDYLQILQEGAIFKSKIVFYEKSLPGFLKAMQKATIISKKYKIWQAKISKQEASKGAPKPNTTWDSWWTPSVELIVKQQSIVGNIVATARKKQKKFTEKYQFQIIDGDNERAREFANSGEDYVIDSFEVVLKA